MLMAPQKDEPKFCNTMFRRVCGGAQTHATSYSWLTFHMMVMKTLDKMIVTLIRFQGFGSFHQYYKLQSLCSIMVLDLLDNQPN